MPALPVGKGTKKLMVILSVLFLAPGFNSGKNGE